MPDTRTPNLNLTKPAVGELAGRDLWGGKLNTNMDILDTFSVTMDGDLSVITGDIAALQSSKEDKAKKGVVNGYAALDGAGKVPTGQLPSYVDDVVMYANLAAFPATGETGKIYVAEDTNTAYRWTGSAYVLVGGTGTASDYINVTGDTMTGPLALMAGAPGNAAYATRKDYVDGVVSAKVDKAGDAMSGHLSLPTGPAAANAVRKDYVDTGLATKVGPEPPNDNFQYARKGGSPTGSWEKVTGGAIISDTPPASPLPASFWWESDTGALYIRYDDGSSAQWVQTNVAGLSDAVSDGAAYGRLNGTWQKVLPLTGGVLTGKLLLNVNVVDYAASFDNDSTANGAGGVLGYAGVNFGVLGYTTGGIGYSFYGNAQIYTGGNITTPALMQCATLNVTGNTSIGGTLTSNVVSNYILNYLNQANITTGTGQWELMFGGTSRYRWQSTYFCPTPDNAIYLGLSAQRWYQVFAVTGTIQTSDEREKRDIRSLDEKERQAAQAIKGLIVAYRWRPSALPDHDQSAAEKIYIGVIAQRVEQALRDAGLNPDDYAMWRKDELTTHYAEEVDEEGNLLRESRDEPNGEYRYSVDYNQVLAFIIGGL